MAVNEDDRRRAGPLGAARALLDRVIGRVREVLPVGKDGEIAADPSRGEAGEPIVTRTMAGLLVSQGHDERALAIYEQLVARHPDDRGLRAEADALRERVSEQTGEPADPVVAVPVRGGRLLLSWQVDAASVERARLVLGGDGDLAARIVLVKPRGTADVVTEVEDRAVDATQGEWVLEGLAAGTRAAASFGVRRGERFVSAAHARVVVVG